MILFIITLGVKLIYEIRSQGSVMFWKLVTRGRIKMAFGEWLVFLFSDLCDGCLCLLGENLLSYTLKNCAKFCICVTLQ